MPVSPVRDIPSFEETRRQTPARESQQNTDETDNNGNAQGKEGLLIDFETPTRQPDGSHPNPFDTFNASSAIRDGKAAAREREEREQRERERQMILEQREARRKSMGPFAAHLLAFKLTSPCSKPPCIVRPGGHTTYLERRGNTGRFDLFF